MEARYVEAGSMSIFWTQNLALKTNSLARVTTRAAPASLSGLFETFFTPRDISCVHAQKWSCGTNPVLWRPADGRVWLGGPSHSR